MRTLSDLLFNAAMIMVIYAAGIGTVLIIGTIGIALNIYGFENLYYLSLILGIPIAFVYWWILLKD